MSGHSKWATIKRKKGAIDAKRGKLFTKLIREITVAAKTGGPKPDANPRLRVCIEKAREASMPNDNIKRAIQRGSGEGPDAVTYEENVYEGYGPGGAAVMVETLTDSRNRTSSELRQIFSRNGGNMGEPGSVGWMFQAAGMIQFDRARHDEDSLMAAALDAGAEDMRSSDSTFDVMTAPADFDKVRAALVAKGLSPSSAELVKLPKSTIELTGKNAEAMVKMMEALEDHDDVQHVWANFDISEKLLESLVGSGAS